MDAEIQQLMDDVWITSLEKICKKDCIPARPILGDFFNYTDQVGHLQRKFYRKCHDYGKAFISGLILLAYF